MTLNHQFDNRREPDAADKSFADSQEAAFRRVIRATIRRGPFTRSERDVVLAFFNHWFHHRTGTKGFVHPGRTKLAKKAGVSTRTVASVLDTLRAHGVIIPVGHLNGLHGKATEYVASMPHLMALCDLKKADLRVNGVQNCTGRGSAEIAHRLSDVVPFPLAKGERRHG